jgi:hypothetical protein
MVWGLLSNGSKNILMHFIDSVDDFLTEIAVSSHRSKKNQTDENTMFDMSFLKTLDRKSEMHIMTVR